MSTMQMALEVLKSLVFADMKPAPVEQLDTTSNATVPARKSFVVQPEPVIPDEFQVQQGHWIVGCETITREKFIRAVHKASVLDDCVIFQAQNAYHNELAKPLFKAFYRIKLDKLQDAIEYARRYVNKYLLHYVLSIALRHRPDLKTIEVTVPAQITLAPHLYFDMGDLNVKAASENKKQLILTGKFDFDNESIDLEHRLEYFRLDPGLNAHHRHWHEAYLDAAGYQGDGHRDRAGELFYYMHSQMLARYNFERLSVNVPLAEPLYNLGEKLAEPHFNKLTTETGAKLWDSRPPNQKLHDISVGGQTLRIQDLELWRARIYEAIDRGYVYAKNNEDGLETLQPLNPPYAKKDKSGIPVDAGIDTLGNMVWAFPKLSVNFGYYGNLHNSGHMIIGYCHDPAGLYYKQSEGAALTLLETACRDPAFYRWHLFIDDIFERYKATLPEYKMEELEYEGIRITAFDAVGGSNKNLLTTKWVKDRVDITRGVAEGRRTALRVDGVYYDFVHLSHEPFQYEIQVYNDNNTVKQGVVRIFMAPRYTDQSYKEELYRQGKDAEQKAKERNPYFEPTFNKLRRLFIELDKFVVTLEPGVNSIVRRSDESTVTVPFQQLFMTLDDAIHHTKNTEMAREALSWCGCGWPDYLLIGRGTADGLPCHLFAMISDYEKDKVGGSSYTAKSLATEQTCNRGSLSYCGVRDQLYPDKKPMGYPFDRPIKQGNLLLADFVTKSRDSEEKNPIMLENMKLTEIKIKHTPGEPENGPTIKYNVA